MDSRLRSRKRKHRSSESDPFGGIFTRSRSQIYLHRHRSGYARADSNRNRNLSKSLKSKGESLVKQEQSQVTAEHRSGYARAGSNRSCSLIKSVKDTAESLVKEEQSQVTADQVTSQVAVKDLRARRVFSPAAISDDVASIGEMDLEGRLDVHKKNDGNPNVSASESDAGHCELGVSYSVADDMKASLENAVDISSTRVAELMEAKVIAQVTPTIADSDYKKNDGNPNVSASESDAGHSELGVSYSAEDMKASLENTVDLSSARETELMEAEVNVQVTPITANSDLNTRPGEKHDKISAANVMADTKCSISKSQSSVSSLHGRRKIFKSPSSFSYRRLIPYLTDLGNNDSSSFEIVEETLPKVLKSNNTVPNMVVCKHEEIVLESTCSKLADGLSNSAKGCETQLTKSENSDLVSPVESSGVVQKSQEDVNDTVEECEQMTPPDSDIFSKPKTDKKLGVLVKPTSKLVLKSCSRMKVLQNPTSFSHRRLLPFLMSVSGDDSCISKGNQSLKLEKATEQNQQPPSHSLLHHIGSMDESKTNSNHKQSSTADEKTDSPTSTLIPIDTSIDRIESVTLVSNNNLLDFNGPDKECSGSISQLEVASQAEAISSDSFIKLEQVSPKNDLKRVEEATSKAIESLPNICTEQSISYCEDNQKAVNERTHQSLLQIAPINGILKRTPRGCRGICNCLNCTSFRLHAERSFEFSRNQLHDAEEVALDLINNLTSLRNILERTASDSNSIATDHEKQVKEECAKALHKEQVARARLAQLNEDLSFHCRNMKLMRPTVTFANKIEEKVISKKVYGKHKV